MDRFVFSHRADSDSPWLPNWVTKAFIRCRRQAGLPHFRLHDLRHFMATEMLQAGIPIYGGLGSTRTRTRVDDAQRLCARSAGWGSRGGRDARGSHPTLSWHPSRATDDLVGAENLIRDLGTRNPSELRRREQR